MDCWLGRREHCSCPRHCQKESRTDQECKRRRCRSSHLSSELNCCPVNTLDRPGSQLHLISGIDGRLPFSLDDASRADTDEPPAEDGKPQQFSRVLLDTRLNNRVVDLRACQPLSVRCIRLMFRADTDKSGSFQTAVCNRRSFPSIPQQQWLHGDSQPKTSRRCNRIRRIRVQG